MWLCSSQVLMMSVEMNVWGKFFVATAQRLEVPTIDIFFLHFALNSDQPLPRCFQARTCSVRRCSPSTHSMLTAKCMDTAWDNQRTTSGKGESAIYTLVLVMST